MFDYLPFLYHLTDIYTIISFALSLTFILIYYKSFHSAPNTAIDVIVVSMCQSQWPRFSLLLYKHSAELDILACSFLFNTLFFIPFLFSSFKDRFAFFHHWFLLYHLLCLSCLDRPQML